MVHQILNERRACLQLFWLLIHVLTEVHFEALQSSFELSDMKSSVFCAMMAEWKNSFAKSK